MLTTHTEDRKSILYLEEDPLLVQLFRASFESFGFRSKLVAVNTINQFTEVLAAAERRKERFQLILSDTELPDGDGLEVIRIVRGNPYWRLTPVIVFSNEIDPEVINAAYESGASCFLPKSTTTGGSFEVLESFYHCWIDKALMAEPPVKDRFQLLIGRSMAMRSHVCELYLNIARMFKDPSDVNFWIDRAMHEGNMSNLLAFIQPLAHEETVPLNLLERYTTLQTTLQATIQRLHTWLSCRTELNVAELCSALIDMFKVIDEEIVSEIAVHVFAISPETMKTLKRHAVIQMEALAHYLLTRTEEPQVHERAREMQAWARRWIEH